CTTDPSPTPTATASMALMVLLIGGTMAGSWVLSRKKTDNTVYRVVQVGAFVMVVGILLVACGGEPEPGPQPTACPVPQIVVTNTPTPIPPTATPTLTPIPATATPVPPTPIPPTATPIPCSIELIPATDPNTGGYSSLLLRRLP